MRITTQNVEYGSFPNNEWIVDFGNGMNDSPADSLVTIEQAVRFALETERFRYPIMGSNFGTIFDDLIGTDYEYIESEIAKRITEALMVDDRIVDVRNFVYNRGDNASMTVTCTVVTVLGDIRITTEVAR